jgi:predicted RNA-binding Zn-ribbon protein involved in translation (DUF1610 family)
MENNRCKIEFIPELNSYIFACPHCGGFILVAKEEINCQIFRHGQYRTGQAVHPHAPRALCEHLVAKNLVYGCCKPLKFDGHTLTICDYI